MTSTITTTICSFDVGIRNLGYALLEQHHDKVCVRDLGVIDFLADQRRVCCECGRKAKIQMAQRKTSDWHYYCGTHVPRNVEKTHKQKPCKHQTIKTISIQDMSLAIIRALRQRAFEQQASVILIENQPGRASQRTKTAQFILYSYFLLQSELHNRVLQEVHLISASRKLQDRVYTGPAFCWKSRQDYESLSADQRLFCLPEPAVANRKRKEYRKRKLLGEAHTLEILQHGVECVPIPTESEPEILERYRKLKKRDDASDALLQGLAYLIKRTTSTDRVQIPTKHKSGYKV
jgi:hypothetical protein